MRLKFDDGTLLLRDASKNVPYAEWDDRVGKLLDITLNYVEGAAVAVFGD